MKPISSKLLIFKMKTILLLILFFNFSWLLAIKKYNLEIRIEDEFGAPLENIEVGIYANENWTKLISNDSGIVILKGVKFKHFKLSIDEDNNKGLRFYNKDYHYKNFKGSPFTLRIFYMDKFWKNKFEEAHKQIYLEYDSLYPLEKEKGRICSGEINDIDAHFIGGDIALSKFIKRFFSLSEDFNGRIFIEFIVEADGQITKVESENITSEEIDKSVTKLLNYMPRWLPAVCDNERYRLRFMLPINI